MPSFFRRTLARRAYVLGLRALGRSPRAAAVFYGQVARLLRFSGGYEVLGRAYREREDFERARDVLREGVGRAPRVAILWALLGSTLCDLGERVGAKEAYRRALACPDVDEASVRYNLVITLRRGNETDEGLAECARAERAGCKDAARVRLELLNDAGRFDEVIFSPESDEPGILAERARAHWSHGRDRARALECIDAIVERASFNLVAADVLRTIDGRRTAEARWFRLIIQGPWLDPKYTGFYRVIDAVADTSAEALEHAQRIHPRAIRSRVALHKATPGAQAAGKLHGIYSASGLMFYERA